MPDTIYGDTYGMCHRSLWTDDVNPLFKDLFMELLHEKTDMIPDGFRVSQLALVALQDVCETLCKEAVDAADYEKQEWAVCAGDDTPWTGSHQPTHRQHNNHVHNNQ